VRDKGGKVKQRKRNEGETSSTTNRNYKGNGVRNLEKYTQVCSERKKEEKEKEIKQTQQRK